MRSGGLIPRSFALSILRISEKLRNVARICIGIRFSTKLNLVASLRHLARLLLGIGLVILGIVGLILPVMPGWIFLIPGLVILADYFPPIRRLVEYMKQRFHEAETAYRKTTKGRTNSANAPSAYPEDAINDTENVSASDSEEIP